MDTYKDVREQGRRVEIPLCIACTVHRHMLTTAIYAIVVVMEA
jgi:hypothetical protein